MCNIIIIVNIYFYYGSWEKVHNPLPAQVGEANDLLPDIAAKAAKLKVVTGDGRLSQFLDRLPHQPLCHHRLGLVTKPALIFPQSSHLRPKPGLRG